MARIKGNEFNNSLTGTSLNDTIYGYAGNDVVNAGTGNDNVAGGTGNDTLNGDAGDDSVSGGSGNDTLNGGDGNDSLKGDSNDDNILGGLGNDTLYGGADNDTLNGGDGDDVMSVGDGVDNVIGGANTATIWDVTKGFVAGDWLSYSSQSNGITVNLATGAVGGAAAGDTFATIEHLSGSKANDTLVGHGTVAGVLKGNAGNDKITAGAAAGDLMVGGIGRDTLTGVATNLDYFQVEFSQSTDYGIDRLVNFDSGALATSDKIVVSQKQFGLDVGTAGSTLATGGIEVLATNVATAAGTRFIFETDTKTLWFDSDGNMAGGEDAYAIAHIDNAAGTLASLAITDFLVIA